MYIGPGTSVRPTVIQNVFNSTSVDPDQILFYPNAKIEPFCGRNTLHFKGDGAQQLLTNGMNVLAGSFMQFEINMGCTGAATDFTVLAEFSDNNGISWASMVTNSVPCDPSTGSSSCSSWSWMTGSVFRSVNYNSRWARVTLAVPGSSSNRRFRLRATGTGSTQEWAITNLYIGNECVNGCSGRGSCINSQCVCDNNFSGPSCGTVSGVLSTTLRETFENDLTTQNWVLTVGGGVGVPACGITSEQRAYVFSGGAQRALITADLDLRTALFMQVRPAVLAVALFRFKTFILFSRVFGFIFQPFKLLILIIHYLSLWFLWC